MASLYCTSSINLTPRSFNSRPPFKLGSHFLGLQSNLRWLSPVSIGPSNGSRATCWFNLRQNAEGAGIYGSQSRDDFNRDDVEQVLLLSTLFFLCVLFCGFLVFVFGNFDCWRVVSFLSLLVWADSYEFGSWNCSYPLAVFFSFKYCQFLIAPWLR